MLRHLIGTISLSAPSRYDASGAPVSLVPLQCDPGWVKNTVAPLASRFRVKTTVAPLASRFPDCQVQVLLLLVL